MKSASVMLQAAQQIACPTWQAILANAADSAYFQQLEAKLNAAEQRGAVVYPPIAERFNALALTPWDQVKVVVLGQDPYHQPGQANGLAFSVAMGTKLPPSLKNIFKALAHDDVAFEQPNHGDLSHWARQGVLLLNTALTVEQGQPGSHSKWGWEPLIDNIIRLLSDHQQPLVFLLWGKPAQQKQRLIQDNRHLVLTSHHPSPLSAYRGFFECKHFSQANNFLAANQRTTIDWQLPTAPKALAADNAKRQQKLAF